MNRDISYDNQDMINGTSVRDAIMKLVAHRQKQAEDPKSESKTDAMWIDCKFSQLQIEEEVNK